MVENQEKVVDMVFKQKLEQQAIIKRNYRRRRRRNFFRISLIITLVCFYFFTELSKPKSIQITGNVILTKDEILKQANIDLNSNLLYANPLLITYRLKKHPFITNASTSSSLFSRVIEINLDELSLFGYRQEDDKTLMILEDGSSDELSSDLYQFLPSLIYVNGFIEVEDQTRLVESFKDLDKSVVSQISEIHQTSVSFDDKLIELMMNDGNKVYTSFQSVERLNYYFDIIDKLAKNNNCIYIDELSGEAYSQACAEQ